MRDDTMDVSFPDVYTVYDVQSRRDGWTRAWGIGRITLTLKLNAEAFKSLGDNLSQISPKTGLLNIGVPNFRNIEPIKKIDPVTSKLKSIEVEFKDLHGHAIVKETGNIFKLHSGQIWGAVDESQLPKADAGDSKDFVSAPVWWPESLTAQKKITFSFTSWGVAIKFNDSDVLLLPQKDDVAWDNNKHIKAIRSNPIDPNYELGSSIWIWPLGEPQKMKLENSWDTILKNRDDDFKPKIPEKYNPPWAALRWKLLRNIADGKLASLLNKKNFGPLSLSLQTSADERSIETISPQSFDSVVAIFTQKNDSNQNPQQPATLSMLYELASARVEALCRWGNGSSTRIVANRACVSFGSTFSDIKAVTLANKATKIDLALTLKMDANPDVFLVEKIAAPIHFNQSSVAAVADENGNASANQQWLTFDTGLIVCPDPDKDEVKAAEELLEKIATGVGGVNGAIPLDSMGAPTGLSAWPVEASNVRVKLNYNTNDINSATIEFEKIAYLWETPSWFLAIPQLEQGGEVFPPDVAGALTGASNPEIGAPKAIGRSSDMALKSIFRSVILVGSTQSFENRFSIDIQPDNKLNSHLKIKDVKHIWSLDDKNHFVRTLSWPGTVTNSLWLNPYRSLTRFDPSSSRDVSLAINNEYFPSMSQPQRGGVTRVYEGWKLGQSDEYFHPLIAGVTRTKKSDNEFKFEYHHGLPMLLEDFLRSGQSGGESSLDIKHARAVEDVGFEFKNTNNNKVTLQGWLPLGKIDVSISEMNFGNDAKFVFNIEGNDDDEAVAITISANNFDAKNDALWLCGKNDRSFRIKHSESESTDMCVPFSNFGQSLLRLEDGTFVGSNKNTWSVASAGYREVNGQIFLTREIFGRTKFKDTAFSAQRLYSLVLSILNASEIKDQGARDNKSTDTGGIFDTEWSLYTPDDESSVTPPRIGPCRIAPGRMKGLSTKGKSFSEAAISATLLPPFEEDGVTATSEEIEFKWDSSGSVSASGKFSWSRHTEADSGFSLAQIEGELIDGQLKLSRITIRTVLGLMHFENFKDEHHLEQGVYLTYASSPGQLSAKIRIFEENGIQTCFTLTITVSEQPDTPPVWEIGGSPEIKWMKDGKAWLSIEDNALVYEANDIKVKLKATQSGKNLWVMASTEEKDFSITGALSRDEKNHVKLTALGSRLWGKTELTEAFGANLNADNSWVFESFNVQDTEVSDRKISGFLNGKNKYEFLQVDNNTLWRDEVEIFFDGVDVNASHQSKQLPAVVTHILSKDQTTSLSWQSAENLKLENNVLSGCALICLRNARRFQDERVALTAWGKQLFMAPIASVLDGMAAVIRMPLNLSGASEEIKIPGFVKAEFEPGVELAHRASLAASDMWIRRLSIASMVSATNLEENFKCALTPTTPVGTAPEWSAMPLDEVAGKRVMQALTLIVDTEKDKKDPNKVVCGGLNGMRGLPYWVSSPPIHTDVADSENMSGTLVTLFATGNRKDLTRLTNALLHSKSKNVVKHAARDEDSAVVRDWVASEMKRRTLRGAAVSIVSGTGDIYIVERPFFAAAVDAERKPGITMATARHNPPRSFVRARPDRMASMELWRAEPIVEKVRPLSGTQFRLGFTEQLLDVGSRRAVGIQTHRAIKFESKSTDNTKTSGLGISSVYLDPLEGGRDDLVTPPLVDVVFPALRPGDIMTSTFSYAGEYGAKDKPVHLERGPAVYAALRMPRASNIDWSNRISLSFDPNVISSNGVKWQVASTEYQRVIGNGHVLAGDDIWCASLASVSGVAISVKRNGGTELHGNAILRVTTINNRLVLNESPLIVVKWIEDRDDKHRLKLQLNNFGGELYACPATKTLQISLKDTLDKALNQSGYPPEQITSALTKFYLNVHHMIDDDDQGIVLTMLVQFISSSELTTDITQKVLVVRDDIVAGYGQLYSTAMIKCEETSDQKPREVFYESMITHSLLPANFKELRAWVFESNGACVGTKMIKKE